MRSKNKEILVVLPNRDECPAGKTKDEAKLLNLVTAEYGIADDILYFNLHKEKNKYWLRLAFIPGHIDEIQTANGKKFVMFELIRNGINSVFRIDDDLNKRMATILGLLDNDDPNAKETIRSKLSAIIDTAGQLDHIVDLLLSDAQFNSFKYTVLNSSKTSCLMCVNSSGISVRSMDAPFEVQDHTGWADIKDVSVKQKRIVMHKNDGQLKEICCLNKKTAVAAQRHLRLYLGFMGSAIAPEPVSWIGRISQRIRKSFTRHPATGTMTRAAAAPNVPASEKSAAVSMGHAKRECAAATAAAQAPSTVPDSSFISEDVMDNAISNVEPSLKTNSTYDVSLGSDNSYRPTITSLSNEELSHNGDKASSLSKPDQQMLHHIANDDHLSFKTTSTYEVSLDSRQMVRPMTIERDSISSSGPPLSSFSISNSTSTYTARTSPPPGNSSNKKDGFVAMGLSDGDRNWTHSSIGGEPNEPFKIADGETEARIPPVQSECKTRYEEPTSYPVATVMEESGSIVAAAAAAAPAPPTQSKQETEPVAKVLPGMAAGSVVETAVLLAGGDRTVPDIPVRTVSATTDPSVDMATRPPVAEIAIVARSEIHGQSGKGAPEPPVRVESEKAPMANSIEQQVDKRVLIESGPSENSIMARPQHGMSVTLPADTDNAGPSEPLLVPLAMPPEEAATLDHDTCPPITTRDAHESPPVTRNASMEHPISSSDEAPHSSVAAVATVTAKIDRPDVLDLSTVLNESGEVPRPESRLPVSKQQRSIPSPKIVKPPPSRLPTRELASPKRETSLQSSMSTAQSPSDKENYQNDNDDDDEEQDSTQESSSISLDKPSAANFSRFEGQEYRVDSKTTITTVSTVGDNVVKRSTQTEIATLKSTGIPTPKQYKSTTTITSTVKKPAATAAADVSKSPSNSATKIPTGIPRMSSK